MLDNCKKNMFQNDSGPLYKETMAGRFPVEPWNTYSNLLFFIVLVYWSIRVYKDVKNHKFIALTLPILLIGNIGGNIYHATRSSDFWLYMDSIPIFLLSFLVATHFILKQKIYKIYIPFIFILPFVHLYLINSVIEVPEFVERMLEYPILVIIVLFPLFRWLYITKWKNLHLIVLSILFISLALIARIIDLKADFLPMGTHWLWHSFGAMMTYTIILYIYKDDLLHPSKNKKTTEN